MKIAISAGELSGDEHGAALLLALKKINPSISVKGMGMRNLKAAGLEIIVDAEKSAGVMGFTELFGKIGALVKSFKKMKEFISEWKPDVLVIINYSDFNLRLAKFAKKQGIKVVFFIPPQVWAWRSGRVKTINKYVDKIISIFPFERDFYQKHNCYKVDYVGHPFSETLKGRMILKEEKERMLLAAGLEVGRPILAILPGSRSKEIENHLGFIEEVYLNLKISIPEIQSFLVCANLEIYNKLKQSHIIESGITPVYGDSFKYMQCADVGLIKSGTSNLQAVFADLPFVMFYKVSELTKNFVKVLARKMRHFSIVNILLSDTINEVVGGKLDVTKTTAELIKIFNDKQYLEEMRAKFKAIREMLSNSNSYEMAPSVLEKAARIIISQ